MENNEAVKKILSLIESEKDRWAARLVIDTVRERELEADLLDYLSENPNVSMTELYQHERMYWAPVIVVSEEKVDYEALYAYEARMLRKLSRFITDENSRYKVWDELLFNSMQRQFMDSMEEYVDDHPRASFEELKEYSTQSSIAWHKRITEEYQKAREVGEIEEEEGTPFMGTICPVCKEFHFYEDDNFELCEVCGWKNDGLQQAIPDHTDGANKMSLNEAQKAWAEGKPIK